VRSQIAQNPTGTGGANRELLEAAEVVVGAVRVLAIAHRRAPLGAHDIARDREIFIYAAGRPALG